MKVRRLTGDGVVLVADEFGRTGDLPVLLLHGGGQSRSAWRSAARKLGEAGYHALAIDLRGHGESEWAQDGDYAFARYATDLAAVIQQLGSPAVLVGASHGGLSSLVAAATYPDLVRALVLADVTPWLDEDHADTMRASIRSAASGFGSVDEAAAMVDALRGTAPRSDASGLRRHMREGEDGRLYWRWDPRFIEDRFVRHAGEGGMLVEAAKSLRVPVLLMHAEFSNVVDERQIEAFKTAMPSLEIVRISGIGHMVTGDDNGAYLYPLQAFLERLRSLTGSR